MLCSECEQDDEFFSSDCEGTFTVCYEPHSAPCNDCQCTPERYPGDDCNPPGSEGDCLGDD